MSAPPLELQPVLVAPPITSVPTPECLSDPSSCQLAPSDGSGGLSRECCVCLGPLSTPRYTLRSREDLAALLRLPLPRSVHACPIESGDSSGRLASRSARAALSSSSSEPEDAPTTLDTAMVELSCGHCLHGACLMHWLHCASNGPTCPFCRADLQTELLKDRCWTVRNIAVPAESDPDASLHGLRTSGWYAVQIVVVPPPETEITEITAVFHPAFSIPQMRLHTPPFQFVVKLCSNSGVVVVMDIEYTSLGRQGKFQLVHHISKNIGHSTYYEGLYTGCGETGCSQVPSPEEFFSELLHKYRKADEYYHRTPVSPSDMPQGGACPAAAPSSVLTPPPTS